MIKNDAAFRIAANQFINFEKSGRLQKEERDYKHHLINTLGKVLSDDALTSLDFLPSLRQAVKKTQSDITNLTHFTTTDDFKKYLEQVPQQRLSELLRDLFDERRDLAKRIDTFLREGDLDYRKYLKKAKRMRWLVSVLLAARVPKRYPFYRPSVIDHACEAWGLERPEGESEGERYVNYLRFLEPIRSALSGVLGRDVDLVDTHSFLWVEYNKARRRKAAESWRDRLTDWLKTNQKTIPDELRKIREEFVATFPKEKILDMTLDEYSLGTGNKNSFSHWLEYQTKRLGALGGFPNKYGVWKKDGKWQWKSAYKDENDALAQIKNGISALVRAVEAESYADLDKTGSKFLGPSSEGLRCKPLAMYFPDQFLPVFQSDNIKHFMSIFGTNPQGDVLALNRQLLSVLRELPEFDGFDPHQMMRFLYDTFPPRQQPEGEGDGVGITPPQSDGSQHIKELMEKASYSCNLIVYGPPGTGKTYLARQFADNFLKPQLVELASAEDRRIRTLQSLKWYQALALTMVLADGKRTFRVAELQNHPTLRSYAALKRSEKIGNSSPRS